MSDPEKELGKAGEERAALYLKRASADIVSCNAITGPGWGKSILLPAIAIRLCSLK